LTCVSEAKRAVTRHPGLARGIGLALGIVCRVTARPNPVAQPVHTEARA